MDTWHFRQGFVIVAPTFYLKRDKISTLCFISVFFSLQKIFVLQVFLGSPICCPSNGGKTLVQLTLHAVKNNDTQKDVVIFGRGSWIRTNEVTESESVALPLGDTPKFKLLLYCIKIIKIFQLFLTHFIKILFFVRLSAFGRFQKVAKGIKI